MYVYDKYIMYINIFNISCSLSYFVPFGDEWDMSYRGGLRYNGFNINYICKSQRNIPISCEYLDDIFKIFNKHLNLYYDEYDPMLQLKRDNNNNNNIYVLV